MSWALSTDFERRLLAACSSVTIFIFLFYLILFNFHGALILRGDCALPSPFLFLFYLFLGGCSLPAPLFAVAGKRGCR
jgi:hypothetical protein